MPIVCPFALNHSNTFKLNVLIDLTITEALRQRRREERRLDGAEKRKKVQMKEENKCGHQTV